jgi:hypothetical protein
MTSLLLSGSISPNSLPGLLWQHLSKERKGCLISTRWAKVQAPHILSSDTMVVVGRQSWLSTWLCLLLPGIKKKSIAWFQPDRVKN